MTSVGGERATAATSPPARLVAVLVPMLGRGDQVAAMLATLRPERRARCVFIANRGSDEHALLTRRRATVLTVDGWGRGDYARKINHAVTRTSEPWLFTGAIDLRFHRGWLTACLAVAAASGARVIGTNDLGNPRTADGRHSTHTLIARSYIEECGTIDQPGIALHEGYWHEYVDDELVATAKARGEYAHAADAHVEHLHPLWGTRPADDVDRPHRQRMRHGQRLYGFRRHLWT